MTDNLFFYIAFAGQVFLLSWYFPSRIHARMKEVFENHPPQIYPKLYPRPPEDYVRIRRRYKVANHIVLALGITLLMAIGTWDLSSDARISEWIPIGLGFLQMVPTILLELSECNQFRAMREAMTSSKRSAEFTPRYFLDYVSPALVTLGVAAVVAAIMFDLYAHDLVIAWGHDTVERAMLIVATNVFFVAFGLYTLRGRKRNPHESHDDRARQISVTLHSLVYTSIALSAFVMLRAAGDIVSLESFEAAALSIYFQIVVWASIGTRLRKIKLDRINFDVYKGNTSVP